MEKLIEEVKSMEKLIEEVRKFPVLYDQWNEKYRDAKYKEGVWKTIATRLKTKGGGKECKKKWASIRDQFRRTLQKRKTVDGHAVLPYRKYKYEDCLEFLIPHLAEQKALSNVADVVEITDDEVSADVTPDDEESVDGEDPESVHNYVEEEPEMENHNVQEETLKFGVKRKRQSTTLQETGSSQFKSYKKEKQSIEETPSKLETHPVDAFLAGIAPPLKSLNPILLNQAKGRIFSVVQEYEMKQLMASQDTSFTLPLSRSKFVSSPESSSAIKTSDTS